MRNAVIDREEQDDHVWGSPPVVRGLFTLLGVAGAGFLVWLATQFDLGATDEFWAAMAILMGAGVVLGLSQLLGGWTKWGAPTISPSVLVLGFLPAFVAVGAILVATRPTGTEEGEQVAGWIEDVGLGGLAADLALFQGVLAFGLGIVLSFTLDTRGPRARTVERDTVVEEEGVPAAVERERVVEDEEVHDYRREEPVVEDKTVVRDDDGEYLRDEDGEIVRDEDGTPLRAVPDERTVGERRDTP
ncbi:MAG TPA: hypothetical protein VK915_01895 [Gaiellaceae bacterium]|nr:hypothetical protein [Gaiellaceae bacterium]